ncbi:MAG TPA: sensor histidine kinase [Thermoanaerobaculia bacterium]|nr:sensor histidine kinase [Thermoanaerobaculia bacterium]
MNLRLIPRDNDLGWTPFAWLIYVVPFTLTPLYAQRHANAAGWTLHVAVTLVFLVLYFRGYWVRGRELILVAAAMVTLGVAFWPVSLGAGAFFIYGAAMLGQLEPPRHAVRGVVFIALLPTVEAMFLRRDLVPALWPVIFTLLIGGINIHFAQVNRGNARLRLAREEIEHLAKVAERERIARDLHDLLGHTLSLVILKSELASKLSERDPERAREEIRDVERISREALAEVRAAVAGYRSGGLASEVQHARNALSTAGATFEADVAKLQLPPAHEAVLCLALREAVTNIVRHAGARHVRLSVAAVKDVCTLTVSDDGRGGDPPFGSGLNGMRERLEILGGTVTRDGRRGTTLVVTLPLSQPAIQEQSA